MASPALVAGKLAHEQLQEALTTLAGQIEASPRALELLLGFLSRPGIKEIDQLAFGELLLDLPASGDIDQYLLKLDQTIGRFEAELPSSMGGAVTRGLEARPQWESYTKMLADDPALKETASAYAGELAALSESVRGSTQSWKDDALQLTGRKLPAKTVVLTFDDGPHARFTPAILDILQRYRVPAVFFEVGRNIKQFRPAPRVSSPLATSWRTTVSPTRSCRSSHPSSSQPKLVIRIPPCEPGCLPRRCYSDRRTVQKMRKSSTRQQSSA